MSKKTKKSDVVIDGILYKQIQWSNGSDTNWKNIPKNPSGMIGSGFHRVEKNKQNSHWDIYDGAKKIGSKPMEGEIPKFSSAIINFRNHGIFLPPPDNNIAVLRGSDKPMGWISLRYYKENRDKYILKFGIEENPDVVVELNESTLKTDEVRDILKRINKSD